MQPVDVMRPVAVGSAAEPRGGDGADAGERALAALSPGIGDPFVRYEARRTGRRLGPATIHPLRAPLLHAAPGKVPCSSCNLRTLCLPAGLTHADFDLLDGHFVVQMRKVARGDALFRAGDRFEAVFPVRTGFFKTVVASDQGLEQVTGFQMFGELLGLGGIDTGRHEVDAVALEDSQVCIVPYAGLAALAAELPALHGHLYRLMSREIGSDHVAMLQLGSMHAEERLAAFLLNLMHRLRDRGRSESAVLLRMSREEIGSYLGLKLETVSRTFSKFQAAGLLSVQHREIQIIDEAGLQRVLGPVRS